MSGVEREHRHEYLEGYISASLWCNGLEYVPGPSGYEEPELGSVDLTKERDRLTFSALVEMVRDAIDFYDGNRDDLAELMRRPETTWRGMGYLFALSRAGHGAGFFEIDGDAAQRLQKAARVYGSQDLLIHLIDRKIEVL